LLQQSEADRMSKSSGLAIREEVNVWECSCIGIEVGLIPNVDVVMSINQIAAKNEIALAKKEQELLLLQEKISSRERVRYYR
jgi:hypothetical protein